MQIQYGAILLFNNMKMKLMWMKSLQLIEIAAFMQVGNQVRC